MYRKRMYRPQTVIALVVFTLIIGSISSAAESPPVDQPPSVEEAKAAERTPPRLSFMDGQVSFWRPGAEDWTPAQVNVALAPGDQLYSGERANLELQVGAHAYVRAGANTQLGLESQEPDFVQFKVTSGHASFDLRSLSAGETVELDTPNAAFTIERTGYYRVNVDQDSTTFINRRGGRAAMTPAGGEAVSIAPSEEVVVQGTDHPSVETYIAPEVDNWDRWNYRRTDHLIDSISARYLSPGIYGADALDHYGRWRVVQPYGPVWVPAVAAGWAPYSNGRWVWDPYYGWTWVDFDPWGWAPYHYGRWVSTAGFWAWAPGPVVVAPVYAPALVAFFGGAHFGVSIGIGVPAVEWVALGWGEPCIPWWGPTGFVGRPWWGGWGGPRIVNNIVVNKTTVINVNNITYQNVQVRNSVIGVRQEQFGRGLSEHVRLSEADLHNLEPVRGLVPVKPVAASLVPASGHALRPPEVVLNKGVVATRASHDPTPALRSQGLNVSPHVSAPAPRLVTAPRAPHAALESPRPPFGQRGTTERPPPPLPPRFGTSRRSEGPQAAPRRVPSSGAPAETRRQRVPAPIARQALRVTERRAPVEVAPARPAPSAHLPESRVPAPRVSRPRVAVPHAPQAKMGAPSQRMLPGEPANRLFHSGPVTRSPRGGAAEPGGHSPATSRQATPKGKPQRPADR